METALETRGNTTPSDLLEIAISKDVDIEKLERLMTMKLEWERNEARKAFHAAMSEFKKADIVVKKDQHVSFGKTKYDHASLHGLMSTVTHHLSGNGLSLNWELGQVKGEIEVTCVVTHMLGHSERTSLKSMPDASGGKNTIQAIGSATEYLRRYTALAILGIAAGGMDDDGRGNYSPNSNARPKEPHGEAQPKKNPQLKRHGKEWVKAINAALNDRVNVIKLHRTVDAETEKDLMEEAELLKEGLLCPDSDSTVKVSYCAECQKIEGCPSWAQ